jgi:predicted ester cyclase
LVRRRPLTNSHQLTLLLKDRTMHSKHVAAVHKFYDVFASGDVAGFDEILSADWQPLPAVPGNPGGRDGQKGTVHFLRSVLADLVYTVEEIYECNAEVVACRCVLRGAQRGPFLNLSAVGSRIELMTMEFHYFESDRIVRTRHIEDFFGVYQQLLAAGAKPMVPGASQ